MSAVLRLRPGLAVVVIVALHSVLVGRAAAAGEAKPQQDPPALSRAEVVKRAKPAIALVDLTPNGQGTAFCVDPSGLFLTNNHVVLQVGDQATVKLVMDSGRASQRVVNARVLRRDKGADLALLQAVDGAGGFPSVPLGSDEKLAELDELVAFGFPFGSALAEKGESPAVSVNAVNVSSLRYSKGALDRIQLDSALNPGNSGGPVVDRSGKVAGVVVSGIVGAGINLAIPASHVRRFVAEPVLTLAVPAFTVRNRYEPATFRATAAALVADPVVDADPIDVDLVLRAKAGAERRVPMTRGAGGRYEAQASPFVKPDGEFQVRLNVAFPDGSLTAAARDDEFKVGGRSVRLSEVRSLRPGPGPATVVLRDGARVEGELDLKSIRVSIGGQPLDLRVGSATEVLAPAESEEQSLTCALVARRGERTIARHEQVAYVEGLERATLEKLAAGRFVKPLRSAAPTTYLHAQSTAGDYIGQGQAITFDGAAVVTARPARGAVGVDVGGWTVEFAAPRGGVLAAGEYPDAKRYPFNDDSPGLSFTGHGRGSNAVGGKFVVWELETENGKIKKLAIDFVHRSEVRGPPLYGMLRYNSSFE